MTLPTSPLPTGALAGRLHRNWGWLLGLGVIMVVLGVIGLGMLPALTVLTALWIGVLMLKIGRAHV